MYETIFKTIYMMIAILILIHFKNGILTYNVGCKLLSIPGYFHQIPAKMTDTVVIPTETITVFVYLSFFVFVPTIKSPFKYSGLSCI